MTRRAAPPGYQSALAIADPARRRLLQAALGCSAAGAFGALPLKLNIAAAAAADGLAKGAGADYKALVCLFLFGGNDNGNTLIPYDTPEYDRYLIAREGSTARPYGITRLRTDLRPLTAPGFDARQFALPVEMTALREVYEAGDAAVLGNIGLLAYPTTRATYDSGSVEVPPQLFSHSDQATFWQAGVPSYATSTGWGGRIVDLFQAMNAGSRVSSAISVAGSNLWQVGNDVIPFPIDDSDGAVALFDTASADYGPAFATMLNAPRTNLLERQLVNVYRSSIAGEVAISEALAATTAIDALFDRTLPVGIPGPAGGWHVDLMNKLAMVTRMIASSDTLGIRRQVFFVSIGGFDMHNTLEYHRYALKAISDGLARFLAVLGGRGLANQVTTFTASDFGRPLKTNGTGSDHGWGAHHLVVGGALNGRRIHGSLPTMDLAGPQYAGNQGHLIPTTSVDQLIGSLARWMGVSDTNLPLVAPNLSRFNGVLPLFGGSVSG